MAKPYSVASLEKALELHFPGRWQRRDKGWKIATTLGPLHLKTKAECYALCMGAAEADRRARNA